MTTVDGLTKTRMLAIEAASVVSGAVDGVTGHLLLTTHGGTVLDAGPIDVLGYVTATSETYTWSGSAYVKVTTRPKVFVGPNDPAASTTVPEGSIWLSNA